MKKLKWFFPIIMLFTFSCENLIELERQNILSVEVFADSVGFFSAVARGELIDLVDKNIAFTQHGHCWSTSPNPTIEDKITTFAETSLGESFISELDSLRSGTTYYVRTYVLNEDTTYYSNQTAFTTNPFASVDILNGTSTGSTATIVSSIDLNGIEGVPDHGHVIAIEGTTPSLENHLAKTSFGPFLEGDNNTYRSSFQDLAINSYTVRAYISTQEGQAIYSRPIVVTIR